MYQEDYLLRLIQQLGAFVAQIAGLNQKGEYDQALATADQAWGKLLEETPRTLIDTVDTPTLAGMLREPAKIRAAAQLFVEEGRALAGKGDPQLAAARFRRAMELIFEARALDPAGDAPAPGASASSIDPSKPGPSKPGPSKPNPSNPTSSKPNPSKPSSNKPDPSKQDEAILRSCRASCRSRRSIRGIAPAPDRQATITSLRPPPRWTTRTCAPTR